MTLKQHRFIAAASMTVAIFAMIIFEILAYFIPHVTRMWAELDDPLPAWQTVLVHVSHAAEVHRYKVMVFLGAMVLGTILWRLVIGVLMWRASKQRAQDK